MQHSSTRRRRLAALAVLAAAAACGPEHGNAEPPDAGARSEGSLVFTTMPETGGTPWIFVAPFPGLEPVRRLPADSTVSHSLHAVSPDGSFLVASLARFLPGNEDEDGSIPATYEYHVYPLTGGPPVRLRLPAHPEESVGHWRADTAWLYFSATVEVPRARQRDRYRPDLFRIRYDGTGLSTVATGVRGAVFLAGGSALAFRASDTDDLHTMRLDGSDRRRLTHFADSARGAGMTRFDPVYIASGPVASPGGGQVAIVVSRRDTAGAEATSELYVYDTGRDRPRRLAFPQIEQIDDLVAWSPAGDRLLVYGNTPRQIFVVEIATGRARHVPGWKASWSPRGDRLLVQANDGLYMASADGTGARRIAPFSPFHMLWAAR